jgi:DNA polymerase I
MGYKLVDYLGKARELRARVGREKDTARTPTTPPAPSPHPNGVAGSKSTDLVRRSLEYKAAKKCELITDSARLAELATSLQTFDEIALDTETYPQDDTNSALDPRRGRIRLISVAAGGGVGGVMDVREVDPGPLLDALRNKTLVAHNAAFDLAFLRRTFGYEHDGPVFDTQVMDSVLHYAAGPRIEKAGWIGFPQGKVYRRRLSEIAKDYLGVKLGKDAQTSDFGREKLAAEQVDYALKDAEVLLPLKEAMMKKVKELGLERVVELECRATPAIAYCEDNGFALDVEGWREQACRAAEEAARIKDECSALAPPVSEGDDQEEWNWGSTKQLGQALELLGASMPRHPTGNYKTDDATLKAITSPEPAVRLVQAVLRYREAKKSASTWGTGWFDLPKKKPKGKKFDKSRQIIVDGRVFSSFMQVVKTGRMSSSAPNLQNIPPDLRKYFVAPPGRKLLIADYKQIELVTAAVVAGETKLLEVFRRGDDVHALTAGGILQSDPSRDGHAATDEEIKAFRPKAKMVSFGILYGITAQGLAGRITNAFGVRTSKEEAQAMIDRFLDTYPALKEWYLEERRKANAGDDYTRTLSGRLRLLDIEHRFGGWRSQYQLRLNTPIQGSAGDGFKYAAALLWERRRDCPGKPKVVNLIHDEVVVEIDANRAEESKGWLERCMLEGMAKVLGPEAPVSVEVSVSDIWAEK